MHAKISQLCRPSRFLHTTGPQHALQQKLLSRNGAPQRVQYARPSAETGRAKKAVELPKAPIVRHAKRNEVGVQLLSRKLHEQIFRNVSFPPPDKAYVQIARDHLKMHGLDPTQGSVLPDTSFTLPPLQGKDLDQHFHNIGLASAQPWLSLATEFASVELPPRPEHWNVQAGWTKYVHAEDGSDYCFPVDFPEHNGQPETMLVFDVETLPAECQYAIMACAATKNGWYSWISPWLLGESSNTQQLIPFGSPEIPRVIVGHNVSYDRARTLEEYSLEGTRTRFIDTMSLHVAVKGISSNQRPAWLKRRKQKEIEEKRKAEAVDVVVNMLEGPSGERTDDHRLRQDLEESLPELQADDAGAADRSSKTWEDVTSGNALADVAKLHCGIKMDKETRNDFMTHSREEILSGIQHYLNYCSFDTYVTHAVFRKVLPDFRTSCPSPVSFAGILTMGSSFLTVNQEWERYIANAESKYKELEERVRARLVDLAYQAKDMMESEAWRQDVWLSQLDWTPKVAGKSRGVVTTELVTEPVEIPAEPAPSVPPWYKEFISAGPTARGVVNRILPYLLRMSYDGHPLIYSSSEKWHYLDAVGELQRLPSAGKTKTLAVLSRTHGLPALKSGKLAALDLALVEKIIIGKLDDIEKLRLQELAQRAVKLSAEEVQHDPWLRHLDWRLAQGPSAQVKSPPKPKTVKLPPVLWPKWFWDITKPKAGLAPGTPDLSVRNRFAPLLLRLSWLGFPLFYSHEHGWTYRVASHDNHQTRLMSQTFHDVSDNALQEFALRDGFIFYKLPHKDGEKANVGSPLAKTFVKYSQDGTLTSPDGGEHDALDMNAQCSYWISARDRVMKQMVVWQNDRLKMGIDKTADISHKWGVIIPQVITMGTVTRRAIEKTWLTASNAKKNRVGSELKAMVRAPEGYSIVGADVDSEELWISSAMGDAQFGLHGATALGWMTLEGTKAAGTDLHSKTAGILGISRDQAKVFNYSRIYGAGMRHAVLLLLQSNAAMLPERAEKLAKNLYASTKGRNTHRIDIFGRKFWFGGTESYVFNKLEEIALSDKPQTPALGCGITYALSKEYLPEKFGYDYMTSRINWVVQSSGVDYLHLLIVAMDHLIAKYNIQARYLISVHDELRYLVKDDDKYRAALALQIANLWTRCFFSYKLGMDDLPQGVAFFSAVDIDTVLRKEVDMPCVTPSQSVPIPPGESVDITKILEKTNGGSLWVDGAPMMPSKESFGSIFDPRYQTPNCNVHRSRSASWLRAQATTEFAEIKMLAQRDSSRKFPGAYGGGKKRSSKAQTPQTHRKLGNGEGVDWPTITDQLWQIEQAT